MRFIIEPPVFATFPDLNVAVIVLRGIDNTGEDKQIQERSLREQQIAKEIFASVPVVEHPNIATWRAAYRAFGAGSDYRSSIEALSRRAAKGNLFPQINKLVDLYNLASIKYLVPTGGEDLKMIKGDLRLTQAAGTEDFVALGETENDPPSLGEIIYADDAGCICRRFNWREADRTKLTAQTKHALLVLEGLPPVTGIEVKEAAAFLSERILAFCGGTAALHLLNQRVSSMTI